MFGDHLLTAHGTSLWPHAGEPAGSSVEPSLRWNPYDPDPYHPDPYAPW